MRLFRARTKLRKQIEATLDLDPTQLFGFEGPRCDRIVEEVWAELDSH